MLCRLEQANVDVCGGKAAGLARLIDVGLAVPAALCLPTTVYRAVLGVVCPPAECTAENWAALSATPLRRIAGWSPNGSDLAALQQALIELGPRLMVRSSATCEDVAGRSAAGIFSSCSDVSNVGELVAAIRACWSSLWQAAAWAFLCLDAAWPGQHAMAVVLQRQVDATVGGAALSRDPRQPDAMRIEAVRGSASQLVQGEIEPQTLMLARAGQLHPVANSLLPLHQLSELRTAVRVTETAFDNGDDLPLEVEWVMDSDRLWLVQARYAPRSADAAEPFPLIWRDEALANQSWRWDAEHNPDPLSPIHASLIEHVQVSLGLRDAVVQNGFLYQRSGAPLHGDDAHSTVPTDSAQELNCLQGWLANTCAQRPAGDAEAILRWVVATFTEFVRRYRQLASFSVAWNALRNFLQQQGVACTAAQLAQLVATADHTAGAHVTARWNTANKLAQDSDGRAWLAGRSRSQPPAVSTLR